jgi:DNA invertase Pin-like site-specific DNA recombinase
MVRRDGKQTSTRLRCAIYTRKSSEEGLEQDFNSLDAQRDACASFIRSQAGLGWILTDRTYEDGGISGGTMDRPGLQALLADVKAGRVNVVVVYKIDRLTRSLADFVRMVEVFDAHEVSFVSVTQQFNTTTSMGRLTLNVLLSFAQFEREVTAERIRDKIAASKRKGLWMGGVVPFGYRASGRSLVIEPTEEEVVRRIFALYLEAGSIRVLKERLEGDSELQDRLKSLQNKPSFSRGALNWMLKNPIYVGMIRHGQSAHQGQHPPLIDRETWDAVQAHLQQQARRKTRTRGGTSSPLLGKLFDETGDPLIPTHSSKGGRRYRYYVSQRLIHEGRKDEAGWRLPASEIEQAIISALSGFFADEGRVAGLAGRIESSAIARAVRSAAEVSRLIELSNDRWQPCRELIDRIQIAPGTLTILLDRESLQEQLGLEELYGEDPLAIVVPFTLRRRGHEARLAIGGEAVRPIIDRRLVDTLTLAHRWLSRLTTADLTISALARAEGVDDGEISRIQPLAFLAPDITEAILDGRQPVELTARHLKRLKPLPASWVEQRKLLGFTQQSSHRQ